MATVNLPPAAAAKQQQQASRILRLNSPDPLERYTARQESFNEAAASLGRAMVQQAKANAAAVERQDREAQRAEREFYKNKYKEI